MRSALKWAVVATPVGIIVLLAIIPVLVASGSEEGQGHDAGGAPVAMVGQQDCTDDVRIDMQGLFDRLDFTFKDPPDYTAEDDLGIYFQITNASCRAVDITVGFRGSVSDATIYNRDGVDKDACLEGCTISEGGVFYGNVGWDLGRHPNTRNEYVIGTITIDGPDDFTDETSSNNTATSTEWINIVNPVSATATPTPTPPSTSTPTPTATPAPAATNTPTPTPTATPTATAAPPATSTPIPTATPTPEAISTPSPTPTRTATPSATATPMMVATNTPTPTATPTPEATATPTMVTTNTPTPTPTPPTLATGTPTPTSQASSTPTPTVPATRTPTPTATPTATPTVTPTPVQSPTLGLDIAGFGGVVGIAGETLAVAAEVSNPGEVARAVTVQMHYMGGGTFEMLDEVSDISVAAGSSADVELEWDTEGFAAGRHPLLVSVLVDGQTDTVISVPVDAWLGSADAVYVLVGSSEGTSGHMIGQVAEPSVVAAPVYPATLTPTPTGTPTGTPTPTPTATPLPRADIEIVGIASDPSGSAMRGQWVEIAVTVRNNGSAEVEAPVRLTFPSEGKRPETTTVAVVAGGSGDAAFTWKTQNYDVGAHTLRAELVVENNETLGATESEITVNLLEPTISASIEGFSVEPGLPVVGEAVVVSVGVRNDGILPAHIPVTLHFPSAEKQPETRKPRAEPGETVFATFTWRTGHYEPGNHEFRVSTPGGERSFSVTLVGPMVDFSVIEVHGPDGDTPIVQGDWVEVSALVLNGGPQDGRATVLLQDAGRGRVLYSEGVNLRAHESQVVDFTWKTLRYGPGTYRLQVETDTDNDTNRGNDVAGSGAVTIVDDRDITVGYGGSSAGAQTVRHLLKPDLPASPDFSIEAISWSPDAPVVGEAVSITVVVANHGTGAVRTPVTLHFPSGDKQPETQRLRIEAGESSNAAFTWRTSRYEPGTYSFRVESANGVETFSIELLAPTVDFEVVAIYPPNPTYPIVKGDWAEVAAFVRNAGEYDGRGTISLWNLTNDRLMYEDRISLEAGESGVVEFTWKTLRYEIGEHVLQVEADAEYDVDPSNNHSDTAVAEIITNRDITVGYGGNAQVPTAGRKPKEPRLGLNEAQARNIMALNGTPMESGESRLLLLASADGVAPASDQPNTERSSILGTGWFRLTPALCAEIQRWTAGLLDLGPECPGVWALVR